MRRLPAPGFMKALQVLSISLGVATREGCYSRTEAGTTSHVPIACATCIRELAAAGFLWQVYPFSNPNRELPFTGGGVEALLPYGHQVVGVDGLHVERHLLYPLLQRESATGAARTMNTCSALGIIVSFDPVLALSCDNLLLQGRADHFAHLPSSVQNLPSQP